MVNTTNLPRPGVRLTGLPAKLANAVLFNVSWFAILVTQSPIVAAAILCLHLVVHFLFLGNGKPEALLILVVTITGATLDQLLFLGGVFNLAGEPSLAPFWLACVWPVFATTLMHAFDSLASRPVVASAIGAAGGALSYIAGTRLTEVEFGSPLWGPVIIGLLWAILFPSFLKLAVRLRAPRDALQSWEPAARRAFE